MSIKAIANPVAVASHGLFITAVAAPSITTVVDNGDQDAITVTVSGVGTIQLYYRIKYTTTWTTGLSRSGSGNIVQTGLTAGKVYELYITDTVDNIESPPGSVKNILIADVDVDTSYSPEGTFDQALVQAAQGALDVFGETIFYHPYGGGSREILAIVTREQTEGLDGAPHGHSPLVTIEVANDSTTGITSAEVDRGGDTVELPVNVGETTKLRKITKIISQDAGMIKLEVR